jgi:hypothetical protein
MEVSSAEAATAVLVVVLDSCGDVALIRRVDLVRAIEAIHRILLEQLDLSRRLDLSPGSRTETPTVSGSLGG